MEKQYFKFSGSGGEYFKIWIVNLLLTIVTLGIYGAWAKVRRNQYFYRNTWLDNSSFDYHGDPIAILKGRIIALILFTAYSQSIKISVTLYFVALAVVMAILPWLIQRSLKFKLRYSSYHGLRFRFGGSTKDAYMTFLLWPVLTLFTLYLLSPFTHKSIKQYQHGNSFYGNAPFSFTGTAGSFYKVYGKAFAISIAAIIGVSLFGGALAGIFGAFGGFAGMSATPSPKQIIMIVAAVYGFMILAGLFIGPYFSSRINNLIWNNTQLENFSFGSQLKARSLFWIYLTNVLGIICTLGLFKPFATVRLLKYKLENMYLEADSHALQQFVADQAQEPISALGEGAADIFDIDISL
ncbi:MAG: DUF898 domain-containing protein [Methylotenera sp.]|nr:DUF898 domain-containing protein [Methylotenera sp.]